MSSLSMNIDALRNFLENGGGIPVNWDPRVVEIGPDILLDEQGRFRIARTQIRTVVEYEGRFKELLLKGLPWVNLSCLGILDGHILVGIEVPRPLSNPVTQTSVNYSGPTAAVSEANWNANLLAVFE